ncbi:MAG: FHA domain-containing protein [Planctomycetes bacterium]|nr:FHA domain-containing protein [Planctomycetota bacterium]
MAVYLMPLDKGRPIVLDKTIVFVGRHPECDVVLKDSRKVSRKHCCIAQVDDRIVVRDLGSMNGVRLNGERINGETPVLPGDELIIGDVGYVLRSQDAAPQQKRRSNGRGGHAGEASAKRPAAPRPQPGKLPARPEDLSQDVPIPIPEESGEFRVEESLRDKRPPRDSSDDVIPLSDE